MNSLSKGTSMCRVTSLLLNNRSALPRVSSIPPPLETICRTSAPSPRSVHTKSVPQVSAVRNDESGEGFVKRILKQWNPFDITQHKLKRSGYLLYESVADKIDYQRFFIEFNMKDTFFSWFLITELHIWMLMVRTMAEQEDGKITRNSMLEAMWEDATARAKTLWSENPSGVRNHIREISEQFNCAIIGYDEGVNGDDKVLAGAIWRRIFQLEYNDPENLERLLAYVRKQIVYLEKLSKEEVLWHPKIEWPPLEDRN